MEELREMIRESYQTTMTGYMEELEQLYQNKIVEFENMDDIYARKAADCYWKYSSPAEAVFDGLEWLGDAAEGLVTGAMDGVTDLIDGTGALLFGMGKLAASGIDWMYCQVFGSEMEDWAEETLAGTKERVTKLLEDPMSLVEGLAQGISDTYEEKGIWYCGGYVAGTAAGAKVAADGMKGMKGEVKRGKGVWKDAGKGGTKTISYTDYDNIYQSSIHNAEKDKVMLGKYDDGGATSYITKAGSDYEYFSLGTEWDAIKTKYGYTDNDRLKEENEFLEEASAFFAASRRKSAKNRN